MTVIGENIRIQREMRFPRNIIVLAHCDNEILEINGRRQDSTNNNIICRLSLGIKD